MPETLGIPGVPTIVVREAEGPLVPLALIATTEHEYGRPVVSPGTVIGVPGLVTTFAVPPAVGVHVARNAEIGVPLLEPALNATTSGPTGPGARPDTTETIAGGAGAAPGITDADGDEAAPTPETFLAATTQV